MIEMENVTKSYGENKVLEKFSLKMEKGEAVAVVGKSGCGKTTLLRILAGLDRAYEGHVLLKGAPADGKAPRERELAMVFQEPALWNHMTVAENILFPLDRGRRKKASSGVEYICAELGIGDLMKRYPGQISGGQAKRVSLARALVSGKEILLLDEPLSNVDGKTREKVMGFLKREYIGKSTVLYVTHDFGEAEYLCSRTVVL
ncbi:MAG: ATP-binding cassette domain-containing protein [Lachnospiraceae bacterium]|jgi:multiple sugar transport system ATP-binding protein|nr:ATP-binding cassette domain-containing protein [Lachnospiraceae bacterium]